MHNPLTTNQVSALIKKALMEYEQSESRPSDVFYTRIPAGRFIYKVGIEPDNTSSRTVLNIRVVIRGENNGQ